VRTLGAGDDGSELTLAIGEQFALVLAETPTTGFRWVVASLPALLAIEHDEFTPPASTRPGAGGEHRWVFSARAMGSAMLKLELTSSVRRAADPTGFTLRIEVGGRQSAAA
jgi:predicted secreted protein